jgi:ribbon-helix-helix protein, copG family
MSNLSKNKKSEVRKMQKKVTVRFDDSDYNFIDEQSKKLNVSKADLVRNVFLNRKTKLSKLNSLSSDEAGKYLHEIVSLTNGVNDIQTELKRIGNNINQIAKKANIGVDVVDEIIQKLNSELNQMLSLQWDRIEVNHGYKQRKD